VLNAADYGVPQNRERLFLVGIRADLDVRFRFPKPTHGLDSPNKRPYITAGDALKELENEREVVPAYGGKYGHLLPDIPPGENYRYYTEELGHEKPLFAWRSKFSGFLYKLSPNEVSRTIVASQSRYDGPFHWKNRKCTIDELKRLQGFPDEFVIPHPYNEAVKQIGNSVCPPIATQIGKALRFQVEGINTKTAGTDLYVTEIGEKDWPRVRRAINRLESDYMKITSGNIFKLITDKPLKDSTALTSEQLKGYLESAIPNTAKKCPISTSRNWRREKNTKKDSDYIAVTQSWLPVKDQTEVAQELGATIVRHARWLSPKDADEEEWAKRFKYELEKREKSMAWFLKNNDYTDEIRIYLNEQYSEDVINDEDGDGDFMDRQLLQVA
jgi:hypothetical protein